MKNPANAKTVIMAEGLEGDVGAVFDLAPESRLGGGQVSSKHLGDGVRNKGEESQPGILPPQGFDSPKPFPR
jgi:hypothetical protein